MGSGDTSVSIFSETGMTHFGSSKIFALEGVKARSSAFAAAINDAMADSEARLHRLARGEDLTYLRNTVEDHRPKNLDTPQVHSCWR